MRRMTVYEAPDHRMGGEIYYREHDFAHDPELHHAYKCGVKQGWREAMEEQYGGSYHHRDRWRELPPMMREHDHDWRQPEPDEIVYRRGRDSRGRYI